MKKTVWMAAGMLLLGLAGCGPAHPEEAEVMDKLVGNYCSENARYKVELNGEGRYEARRSNRGAFATGMIGEKCEGNFKLVYEGNAWNLNMEKSDKNSNPFIKCPGHSVKVWEAEKGYVMIDSIIRITEPFDQTELKKDCGGGL